MASDTNSLTISGRLGRDPEIRFTGGGSAVASASVVVGRSWKNKTTDEWENQDFWIKVTAWGTLGENFAQSCYKGDKIIATGRLEVREYERKDGSKGTSVDLVSRAVAERGPVLVSVQRRVHAIAVNT